MPALQPEASRPACRATPHPGGCYTRLPMTDTDFEGRIALITGGASGIGAATRAAHPGGRRSRRDPRSRPGARGGHRGRARERAIGIAGDVTSSAELNAAVARVESELGGLDVLVCSAGIAGASLRTTDVDDDEWKRVMAVNADGVFFANRAALPGMIVARLRAHRQPRLGGGQGGQPHGGRLLGRQGSGDRPDEVDRQGRRDDRRARQLRHALAGRDADGRRAQPGAPRLHALARARWAVSRRPRRPPS